VKEGKKVDSGKLVRDGDVKKGKMWYQGPAGFYDKECRV